MENQRANRSEEYSGEKMQRQSSRDEELISLGFLQALQGPHHIFMLSHTELFPYLLLAYFHVSSV